MSDLGWEAKAFVGHLLGLWYDPFEHLLDTQAVRQPAPRTSRASSTATESTSRKTSSSTGRWIGASTRKTIRNLTEPVTGWVWTSHGTVTYCGPKWCRCACRDGSSWSTSRKS